MNKILLIILIVIISFSVLSCGKPIVLEPGELANPYGVFSKEDKNESATYKMSTGNIIWSILLVETIVAPIILIGWKLWVPIEE